MRDCSATVARLSSGQNDTMARLVPWCHFGIGIYTYAPILTKGDICTKHYRCSTALVCLAIGFCIVSRDGFFYSAIDKVVQGLSLRGSVSMQNGTLTLWNTQFNVVKLIVILFAGSCLSFSLRHYSSSYAYGGSQRQQMRR